MASATVKELAGALGLTDRRVRQLADEHILPQIIEGSFADADLCRRRYRLYARGTDTDWRRVYDGAVDQAERCEEMIALAMGTGASVADVATACKAVSALWSDMRFIAAVQSDTQSERTFFLGQWDREEACILSAFVDRAQELGRQVEMA